VWVEEIETGRTDGVEGDCDGADGERGAVAEEGGEDVDEGGLVGRVEAAEG